MFNEKENYNQFQKKKKNFFFLKVSLKLLKIKPLVELELMIHEQDTETPHPGCMVLGT